MSAQSDYFTHHQQLLLDLYQFCSAQLPFSAPEASDTDRQILEGLKILSAATSQSESFQQLGQEILTQLIGHYPHITPNISRDLLWFFGGDCLHFMEEEEISRYQQLDEMLNASPELAYLESRSRIFKLH